MSVGAPTRLRGSASRAAQRLRRRARAGIGSRAPQPGPAPSKPEHDRTRRQGSARPSGGLAGEPAEAAARGPRSTPCAPGGGSMVSLHVARAAAEVPRGGRHRRTRASRAPSSSAMRSRAGRNSPPRRRHQSLEREVGEPAAAGRGPSGIEQQDALRGRAGGGCGNARLLPHRHRLRPRSRRSRPRGQRWGRSNRSSARGGGATSAPWRGDLPGGGLGRWSPQGAFLVGRSSSRALAPRPGRRTARADDHRVPIQPKPPRGGRPAPTPPAGSGFARGRRGQERGPRAAPGGRLRIEGRGRASGRAGRRAPQPGSRPRPIRVPLRSAGLLDALCARAWSARVRAVKPALAGSTTGVSSAYPCRDLS